MRFYTENGRFAVFRPPFGVGGLGTTYDVNLRLPESGLPISVN